MKGGPLRVAVLAPRYHRDIIGGSERYLRSLCEGLAARGVAVEVVTSRSMRVDFEGDDAVRWLPEVPTEDSPAAVRVVRCDAREGSPRARCRWRRTVASGWARAVDRLPLREAGAPFLGPGFYAIESAGDGRRFRWTGAHAGIDLGAGGTQSLRFDLHAAHTVDVELTCGTSVLGRLRVVPGAWRAFEVALPAGTRQVELRASPVSRPRGASRALGVAVGAIVCGSRGGELAIDLEHDESWRLGVMPTDQLASLYDARAAEMSWRVGLADARLKGPWSVALLGAALRSAARADVVVAAGAPYATLALGWLAARLTSRPFVALPFLHLRDASHHRPQVRGPLRRAEAVFCLSEVARRFVETPWRGRAVVLGAGVDPAELAVAGDARERFRRRYGLGDDLVVVQVGRKTPSKGYQMTAEAVARLREAGMAVRFVLVGPDIDGLALTSPGALQLGQLERVEVLEALAACDAFALPSVHESFGLAYLEAWMFSRPVVAHARCDAARELIAPGEDGELVGDVPQLTAALARILAASGYGARLGANGRLKAARSHGWDTVVERALATFEELTGRTRGSAGGGSQAPRTGRPHRS